MPDGSAQNIATGLAGGLIVIALLETLLDKNVIALAEARHVLQRAVNSLSPARTPRNGKPSRSSAECSAATFRNAADKNPRRPRRGSQHLGGAYPAISRALPDLTSAPAAAPRLNQLGQSSARSLRRRSGGSRR
jgi:hypothetical protein